MPGHDWSEVCETGRACSAFFAGEEVLEAIECGGRGPRKRGLFPEEVGGRRGC